MGGGVLVGVDQPSKSNTCANTVHIIVMYFHSNSIKKAPYEN